MGLGKTYSTQYLADSNNNTGVAGQVLSTTSTGIDWVDANTVPGAGLWLESGNDIYNSNSANVGIGTTTPGSKLELWEVALAAPTMLTLHGWSVDTVADDTMGAFIDFKRTDNNASFTPQARIGMLIRDSNGDSGVISEGCGNLVFHTSRGTDADGAGEDVERMRITDIGNVGIGTDSPNTLLDVSSANFGTTAPAVRITSTLNVGDWSGVVSDLGRFEFFTDDTSGAAPYTLGYIGIKNDYVTGTPTLPSGAMVFATTTYNTTGGAVERMRIDSIGAVLIGDFPKIDTATKLQVSGSSSGVTSIWGNADDVVFQNNNNVGITFASPNTGAATIAFADPESVQAGFIQYSHASNSMSFATNGNNTRIFIKNNGKVSIGSTSPVDALDIDWDTEDVATDLSGIRVRAYRPHLNLIDRSGYTASNGHNFQIKADSAKLQFNATSADNETFDLTRMVIDKDGQVGIGTFTPTSLLEISQQLSAASTIDYPYTISSRDDANSINQAGGEGVGIKFRIAGNAATTPGNSLVGASIAAIRESASDTDSSTGLGFFVTQNDETLDEALRIDHDGNVGIGTNDPAKKLHVKESTTATYAAYIENSVAGGDYLAMIGDAGDNVFEFDSGGTGGEAQMKMYSDGTQRVLLDANGTSWFNGSVAIGATSANAKLEVNDSSTNLQMRIGSLTAGISPAVRLQGKNAANTTNYYADISLDAENGKLLFHDPGTSSGSIGQSPMVLDSTGRVGIGTTSPSHKLEVGLTAQVPLASQPAIPLMISNDGQSVDGRVLLQVKHDVVNTAGAIAAGYQMTAAAVTSGTASYYNSLIFLESAGSGSETVHSAPKNIEFYTNNSAGAAGAGTSYTDLGNLAFELQADGEAIFYENVGINTTSPYTDLEINGGLHVGPHSAAVNPTEGILVETEAGDEAQILMYVYGSSVFNIRSDGGTATIGWGSGADREVNFLNTGAGDIKVGIADGSPSYTLDVTGTIRATGDIIAFSDVRVKENIKTIKSSLDKVSKLRGVEFNKIGEDEKSIGVIAQEIEKIIPEVVKTDDEGMKSVAYGNISGLLIEAIKELKAEVDLLKSKPCNCNCKK